MAYKLKLNKRAHLRSLCNFSPKNRRADISITLLVIGVFAVCTLALLSFLTYNQRNQGSFANMELFENLSLHADNFYFYVNSGLSADEAAQKIGAQIEGNKLVLNAKQETPSLFALITKKEPNVVVSATYIVDLNK
jgi:hypothetical protein